ncbi:MAG: Coenzyme F420 hydrogenase/dehydrogenase, beta subunit C-terminal domain [Haloarculaceae archaeon]
MSRRDDAGDGEDRATPDSAPSRPGRYSPRVPDVGDDPRGATRDVDPPANKVWFRDLDEAVVEAGRCVQCGTCVAACPSDSIGVADSDDRPTLVKMCTGCSRCWDTCPRAGLRYERLPDLVAGPDEGADLGPVRDTYAASAVDPADGRQHGGVVTALAAALLADGEIDGAVLAREDPDAPGKAVPALATDPGEVRETAGSLFTQPLQLAALPDLLAAREDDLPDDPSLALVGTPCVVQGVAALRHGSYPSDPWDDPDPVEYVDLTVSLFCTQAFDRERLSHALAGEYDTELADVEKLDLVGNGLDVHTADGVESVPVDDVRGAVLDGCPECGDVSGRTADLSVGAVGSERGESTVLVRTERGERAWERAVGGEAPAAETAAADPDGDRADDAADAGHGAASPSIEARPLADLGPVEQLSAWNRQRAKTALEREFDPEGALGVPYEAHRDAYDGTDRAPAPFNPARVHQYEEWC